MSKLLQIPATISGTKSMANRVLRLSVDTQENLTDEQMGKLSALHEKYGWFCFLPDTEIKPEELIDMPALPKKRAEDKKSPAEQLHALLYIYWKQSGSKGDSELFYRQYIEKRCQEIRERLV